MAKIVQMSSVHNPLDIRIFHKISVSLAEAGHEVVIVAPSQKAEVRQGVRIRPVPLPKSRLNRILEVGWRVFDAAVDEGADVYHAHDPELLPWLNRLRRRGHAVIYDMHENVPKAILTKPWISGPARQLASFSWRVAERALLRKIPVIFAEASYRADYSWVGRQTTVQNFPRTDVLRALEAEKHERFTVGYLGSVTAERGSTITADALGILKSQGLEVGWDCMGPIDSGHALELTRKAESLGIGGVSLAGRVSPEEGWRRLARCHVGLAVLRPIPNYVDSYPTKMFEYMALGLPVVSSNFPLYRAVVEKFDCGICVDPLSSSELAEAIARLVNHPTEAAKMGAAGRLAVQHFDWAGQKAELLRFYEMTLSEGRYGAS